MLPGPSAELFASVFIGLVDGDLSDNFPVLLDQLGIVPSDRLCKCSRLLCVFFRTVRPGVASLLAGEAVMRSVRFGSA